MNRRIAYVWLFAVGCAAPVGAADPWADAVVEFSAGTGATAGFEDPQSALGSPTHFTSPDGPFGGPVTPFNAPFGFDELVSIGEGGSLTVRFDEPVTDDPRNPFGIDLLVFGNSFLGLAEFPADETTPATQVFPEGGIVSVSADGVDFVTVPGIDADGLYPTLGYRDISSPFPASATEPSDFTLPVDPALSVTGLTAAEIVAAYDGSGGGAGIDIGAAGFSEISYVRITNPVASGMSPEIDAFADVRPVPEPKAAWQLSVAVAMVAALVLVRRRAAT